VNTNNSHNTCDTRDEDPRPAKRRKPRIAPAAAPITCRRHTSELRLGQPRPLIATVAEAVLVAEYQEWPFQGFLKRTRIGDNVTYNLEFKLPSISEHFHLPIDSKALDTNHNAAAHSQIYQALLQVKKRSVKRKSTVAATCHPNFVAHYEVPPVTLQAKRTRVPWTEEENEVILEMMGRGCLWDEIDFAFRQRTLQRTLGAIKQQYYTKLK
jgi:hypothetical protein